MINRRGNSIRKSKLFLYAKSVRNKMYELIYIGKNLPQWLAGKGLPLTKHDRRLVGLRNRYKGQRCFVLGNGPSLKRQNIGLLKDEFVFVTNWFFLHEEFKNLKHCFYCTEHATSYDCGQNFNPELFESLSRMPNVKCFFDIRSSSICEKRQISLTNPVFFTKINYSKEVCKGNFSINIPFETCFGWTVIIDMCLPIAFYLGFSTIYLLGCDCDYRLDEAEDFSKSFFYDVLSMPIRAREEMYKSKARQGKEFGHQKQILASYQVVKRYFENHGRRIYNAGHDGKLNVFERINYDNIIHT